MWIPFFKANASVLSIAYFNCISGVWRFGSPSFSLPPSHVLTRFGHSRVALVLDDENVARSLIMTWRVLNLETTWETGWLMRVQLTRSMDREDALDGLEWELVSDLKSCKEDYCFVSGFGDTIIFGDSVWVCGSFGLFCGNGTFVFGVARFELDGFAPQPVAFVGDEYLYARTAAVGQFAR
jgi:hypothetical protein